MAVTTLRLSPLLSKTALTWAVQTPLAGRSVSVQVMRLPVTSPPLVAVTPMNDESTTSVINTCAARPVPVLVIRSVQVIRSPTWAVRKGGILSMTRLGVSTLSKPLVVARKGPLSVQVGWSS